jgi:hypothetical protein
MSSKVEKTAEVNMAKRKYARPVVLSAGTQYYFRIKFKLSRDNPAPKNGRSLLKFYSNSYQLQGKAEGFTESQSDLALNLSNVSFSGEDKLKAKLQITGTVSSLSDDGWLKEEGSEEAAVINYEDNRDEVLIFISFFEKTVSFKAVVLSRDTYSSVLRFDFTADTFWETVKFAHRQRLILDFEDTADSDLSFEDCCLSDMAIWESEDADLYRKFICEPADNFFILKQFPLRFLESYYPLFSNFQSSAGSILRSKVRNPLFCPIAFKEDAVIFDTQQVQFIIDLPEDRTQPFTCAFWMKFSADDLIWDENIRSVQPVPLWSFLNKGGEARLIATWHEKENVPVLAFFKNSEDLSRNISVGAFDFITDHWFFFTVSFSYDDVKKKVFIQINMFWLNDADLSVKKESLNFSTSDLSFAHQICWGEASSGNGSFTGANAFLSSVMLFKGCNLYREIDLSLDKRQGKGQPFTLDLLHLLYRGAASPLHRLLGSPLRKA